MGCKTAFKRGTTPALAFTIAGYDLTGYALYLTFKSRGSDIVVKREAELDVAYDSEADATTITCSLTQEDTLAMPEGEAEVELKATDDGGATVLWTKNVTVTVMRTLLEEVIDGG